MLGIYSQASVLSRRLFGLEKVPADPGLKAQICADMVLEFQRLPLVRKNVEYNREVVCTSCNGSRAEPNGKRLVQLVVGQARFEEHRASFL